jgi:hypothetical protein
MLGVSNVAQPVLAQVAQRHAVGQAALSQDTRCVREQDLSAVGGSCDSGGQVDVDPDVVIAAEDSLPCVKPHPYPKFHTLGPIVSTQVALRTNRTPNGIDGASKGRKERVTLGPNNVPIIGLEGGSDDLSVSILHGSVFLAQRMQKPGGPLDVGEQERDRSSWQRRHVSSSVA